MDALLELQRKNRKKLDLSWDFGCDVKEESAFHVRHRHVISWSATKIGGIKGTGYVSAETNVILPDASGDGLKLVAKHDTNKSQQRFSGKACDVVYLAPGLRTSKVRTVLSVRLPSVAEMVGELLKDLIDTIEKITKGVTKGFEEIYEKLKKWIDPSSMFQTVKPDTDPKAIDFLKEGVSKWLSAIKKLLGEVRGAITLEQSALAFQAVTDDFYDSWLKATDKTALQVEPEEQPKAIEKSEEPAKFEKPGDSAKIKSGFDGGELKKVEMTEDMFLAVDELRPGVAEVHMRVDKFLALKAAADKHPEEIEG